jgi:hypothetical protein
MRAPSEAAVSSYAPNESIAGVHHALSGSFSMHWSILQSWQSLGSLHARAWQPC